MTDAAILSSRAPLDEREVKTALLPFGQSRLLPKAAYLDQAVLDWERQHVFDGWVCQGRADEVAAPGSMKTLAVGDSSILMVRDDDGRLRAFENACRHRGHELLPCGDTAERKRAIVCPYHAWAYNLDGSLRGAPKFDEVVGFHPDEHGLFAVPLTDWHGWVFLDASGAAPDFGRRIGALESVVDAYDAASLVTTTSHEYEVAANWKVIIENYQECYHCPMIHPELCEVSAPHSGENLHSDGEWVGGWMALRDGAETMSLDGRSRGVTIARLDEHEKRSVMYVAVLPNLLISLHPDYVMTHILTPLSPDSTRIRCSWAFPPQSVEQADFDSSYAVDFWDITNKQDWAACESVQRGMHSPSFVPGPLAPVEDAVYQFVSHMARVYLADLSEPPHAIARPHSDKSGG